ncbi:MAG TPA: LysM peptidoglycan-binding domain-containing protein [Acidimicrobiales bacterium]|nr:LysM peptidoglycan-binding domain-containing protein [Acidimicrobiales bacterium]
MRGATENRWPAAATAGTVLVGVPAVLLALVGSPVPSGSDVHAAVSLHYFSHRLDAQLASWLGWCAWGYLVTLVGAELIAQLRGRPSSRLARAAPLGLLARSSVAALLSAVALLGRAHAQSAAVSTAPAPIALTLAAQPVATPTPTYTVVRGDNLWNIARDHLGDPLRWRDIWAANHDRDMGAGGVFDNPSLIEPGWVLELPSDAQVGPPALAVLPSAATPPPPAAAAAPAAPPSEPARPQHQPNTPDRGSTHERAPESTVAELRIAESLGVGLGAVGLATTLSRLRRAQARRRKAGRRVAPLEGNAAAVAAELDRVDPEGICPWALSALSLAAEVTRSWGDRAVLLGAMARASSIELIWDRPLPARRPFAAGEGERRWALRRQIAEEAVFATGADGCPFPMLVRVGRTEDGAEVMLNLEAVGSWSVEGDDAPADELLLAVATQLASPPFSPSVDLVTVGRRLDALGNARTVEDPEELRHALEDARSLAAAHLPDTGCASVAEARLVAPGDYWAPTVVCLLAPTAGSAPELARMASDPASPLCLLARNLEHADQHLVVDASGLHIPLLDLTVSPSRVDHENLTALIGAFETVACAADVSSEEAPFPALREAAPASDEPWEVEVRILGPVEIAGGPDGAPRRTKVVEIIAYLALHREGVTSETLITAIWPNRAPSADTFYVRLSEARRALGSAGETPRISHGSKLRLDDCVATDWGRFQSLADGDLEDKSRALDLVRGLPLADLSPDWFSREGWASELTATITDLAAEVADAWLERGDPERAERYARAGLKVFAWDERLYRIRMRAAARDRTRLASIMSELESVVSDGLEPADSIEPETAELFRRLNEERLRQPVDPSGGARHGTSPEVSPPDP